MNSVPQGRGGEMKVSVLMAESDPKAENAAQVDLLFRDLMG